MLRIAGQTVGPIGLNFKFFSIFFITRGTSGPSYGTYILCLSVRLSVSFNPINVKTAELVVPKFCVGLHMSPGELYR